MIIGVARDILSTSKIAPEVATRLGEELSRNLLALVEGRPAVSRRDGNSSDLRGEMTAMP